MNPQITKNKCCFSLTSEAGDIFRTFMIWVTLARETPYFVAIPESLRSHSLGFRIKYKYFLHLCSFYWGLESERNGRPTDSIGFYKEALEVDRGELSTYEILFSLGRVYFLTGQKDKALSVLREFIKNAEQDLSEPGPWPLTAEGEQVMQRKIAYSKWIIDLSNKSDK